MSNLEYTHLIGDVLTDATSVVLGDASNAYGIKKADDDDETLVVNPGVEMTRISIGTY